jgi:hypothetical protein
LRKLSAVRLAEAGATESEIKAAGGWTTSRQVARYTASASQKRLAAAGFAKLAASKCPTSTNRFDGGTKTPSKPFKILLEKNGARGRIRTTDTAIFSRMLYQLSYPGKPLSDTNRRVGGAEIAQAVAAINPPI